MRYPRQVRTDVDCRAARPKFDNGAWSTPKMIEEFELQDLIK